jgi:hypothetical protein
METNLAPGALLCKFSNGHHLASQQLKDLEWFIQRIGNTIRAASSSYSGPIYIHDHGQAKQLFKSQEEGYTFFSVLEPASHSLSSFQDPEPNKLYRFDYYINGILKDSNTVQYAGLTSNKKFQIFKFINGPNKAGHSCHLLRVGYFPVYQNASNPTSVIFEQYIPLP